MAGPHGYPEAAVTLIDQMKAEPWRFDFFQTLRQLERSNPDQPRIGDSAARREEFVDLGQTPYLEFPASNLSSVDDRDGRLRILVKFLGLLGPQGALPLATTDESVGWQLMRDDAFPRFLDLLNGRFLQLFFRAWADARPIAQHDRPSDDRFIAYVGSFAGLGSDIFANRDAVPDMAKLSFAGLVSPRAKSASRLAGLLQGLFDVRVEIDEFVGSWLPFEANYCSRLGAAHARLGHDALLGSRVFSVEDKIRVRVFVKDFAQYEQFLPTEAPNLSEPLADAVYFYIGDELEWEVELAIPAGAVVPIKLGQSGRLGWTSWVSPNWASTEEYRRDARFNLAERLRAGRSAATDASPI
ncbi:type VI secretion system baseplate subunit TssG [Bradyrhizobium uaiense]|uniref:Type VI secretion system baseplate subunit TssG n=1 Tax=Bradyrhizobium uaiense TaxID=2594946 RepID=A0A6P1BDR0_9BRAD|nr:type VI secretion system baseplate subunit TssG [Bradyrhizobium uaiense]NEU96413.1 type VI secretion system baseplate subunit TssG [Bradyrhizobium uaiense]